MIKCFGFGKLLKQLFIISLISCFGFGVNSFASAGYTRQVGLYGYNPFIQNFDINFTKNGNPLTQNLGYTKQLFTFFQGNTTCSYRDSTVRIYWWWYNGLPYYYIYYYTPGFINPITRQGNITNYWICDEIVDNSSSNQPGNCVESIVGENTSDIFGTFLSTLTKQDNFYFDYSCSTFDYGSNWYRNLNAPFCISNNSVGHSLCFNPGISWSSDGNLTGNAGVPFGYSFDSISSIFLQNPPGNNGNGDIVVDEEAGGIELGSDQSAINYFETRYGRDKNLCYVGIDNLTDLWGSSVSFEAGTGLNIFQVYSGLYGNSDLNKVYVWLNSWLLNYEQWFGRNGNPLYLSNYNSGTNQVDLYYDNLTFPFSNKPVALYFMADNVENYSEYSTQGSEVVSYCNMVINEGTFDEIIDESTKNNINGFTEQYNKSKGLNEDGSKIVIDFSQFGHFTGESWISSGQELAFSGNTSIKNTLSNFFAEFDSSLNQLTITGSGKILPTWLVSAFVFVVLFKFLKRK